MIRNIVFILVVAFLCIFINPQYQEDDIQWVEGYIVEIDSTPLLSQRTHPIIVLNNTQSYVVTTNDYRKELKASIGKYTVIGYVFDDTVFGGPNKVVDLVIDGVRYEDVNTVNRHNFIGYFVCGFLALLVFIGINLKVIFEWIEKRKIIAKNKRKKREREKRKAEREARKLNQNAICDPSKKT